MYTCSLSQPGGCYAASGISPCLSTPTWPRVASFSCTSVLLGAWAHSTHEIYCFLSLSFAFAHTTVCYTNSQNYSDRSPVFGKLAIVSLRLRYDIVFSVNSSDSGMSGTRRHIRLCHYTPTWPPPFQWTSPCVPCLPLNIDYVIRRNLSCLRIIHDVRFFISKLALPVLHPLWLITCTDKPFSDEWYSFSATQTS